MINPDEKRRIEAQARTIHKLRSEISDLRREIEARDEAWLLLDPEYADAIRTLAGLAYGPVRRGERVGHQKPHSQPPPSDPLALARLRSELGHQRRRALLLLNPGARKSREAGWLDQHVGSSDGT